MGRQGIEPWAPAFERGLSGQRQLYEVGGAHNLRGEIDLAIERLEQALRAGGPQDAEILAVLERIRLERAEGRTTGPLGAPPRP